MLSLKLLERNDDNLFVNELNDVIYFYVIR